MNRIGFGVEVIFDDVKTTNANSPSCPHGPMLLFERYTSNGKNNGRRFYACSANRSRKLCNSFYWVDEITDSTKVRNTLPSTSDCYVTRKKISLSRKTNPQPQNFCKNCLLLFRPQESDLHSGHEVVKNISDEHFSRPSKLLMPLEDSRQFAQYFFSKETVLFIVETLKNLKIKNALCIGTPRVHEELTISGFSSLLMDIDDRYVNFYDSTHFVKYNMFNHYFFGSDKSAYYELLSRDGVCILLDPPFGGLIDAIAHTLQQIIAEWKERNSRAGSLQPLVLWFFPYFNEKRIVSAFPTMQMLDVPIDYENHNSFKGTKMSRKNVSPVRMFTNYEPKMFKPPNSFNYRFCDICQKYVAQENAHCKKCQSCTSKDGRPYRHCDICRCCVKVSWHHCTMCQQCVTQDHKCGEVPSIGTCHICGHEGHKRKQCPRRQTNKRKKTRIK